MKFVAWQKISLIDYPGLISTLVFTGKCNFWCEYCHNKSLKYEKESIDEEEIFAFVEKKKGKIDALCITGGEPSLYKEEIFGFVERFKSKFPKLKVKTDTNGSDPDYIKRGVNYFDYVAMDFKSIDYSLFSNEKFQTILKSLNELKKYKDYEVRITMYPPYIKEKDFDTIESILSNIDNIVIQQYRPVNEVKLYEPAVLKKLCSHFAHKKCSVR